ncbi:hypothetical protein D3C81_1269300 [compost metagenome]
MEKVLIGRAADRQVKVHAVACSLRVRLGHERTNYPHVIGDLTGGHTEEGEAICRFHGVAVGVIDLELAVGVFVVDLIDIETHRLQSLSQSLKKFART